jgi:hypothetical protein
MDDGINFYNLSVFHALSSLPLIDFQTEWQTFIENKFSNLIFKGLFQERKPLEIKRCLRQETVL